MDRTLTSIFCDDIRQEVGNKISYIGCYVGQMIVSQFPIVLPKFCVMMGASTPESSPFKQLKFRLLKNDEVLAEYEAPLDAITASGPPSVMEGEELRLSFYQVVQIYPLQIDGPCKFRARAITESGEIRGGGLVGSKLCCNSGDSLNEEEKRRIQGGRVR